MHKQFLWLKRTNSQRKKSTSYLAVQLINTTLLCIWPEFIISFKENFQFQSVVILFYFI